MRADRALARHECVWCGQCHWRFAGAAAGPHVCAVVGLAASMLIIGVAIVLLSLVLRLTIQEPARVLIQAAAPADQASCACSPAVCRGFDME